jgi:hypothetical protein
MLNISSELVSQTHNSDSDHTVIYTRQNKYLYELFVDLYANLDKVILYT